MADSKYVTSGKPKVGGAIFVADKDQSVTNATSTLTNFTNLGFVSEDGLTNARTFSSNDVMDWGGSVVLSIEDDFSDKFSFTLIEVLNEAVLKEVFGSSNVEGDYDSGITVKVKPEQHIARTWVFDMIMRDGMLKRIVVPRGTISEMGEIAYTNDAAAGYEITINAAPDKDGVTHYEYIAKPEDSDQNNPGNQEE